MADEWGPWIEHDGRGCPLPDGVVVELVTADGERAAGIILKGEPGVNVWDWAECRAYRRWEWRLLRYRIRKPRGVIVLEALLADLPESVDA